MTTGALLLLLAAGQGWATGDTALIAEGKAVYELGCASCHGVDGETNPAWESETRPVELSDCTTTSEPTALWEAIVRDGGPEHGLSSIMPAFGETFTEQEIHAVVAYMRTFCEGADAYPPGDLNFRRLLKTGKAYPEREWVVAAGHRPDREDRETELELTYENRLGARFQYEIELPMRFQPGGAEGGNGVGDLVLEAKQVVHFDRRRAEILSAGLGVTLPTGDEDAGLGAGTWSLAPFLAYGKAIGRTLVQSRVGVELPTDGSRGNPAGHYAVGIARSLGPARTSWTPAVELAGVYDLENRSHEYGVWLELSKPLNKLGHVIASAGVELPVRPREESFRIVAFVLWDFGDGPFWVGW